MHFFKRHMTWQKQIKGEFWRVWGERTECAELNMLAMWHVWTLTLQRSMQELHQYMGNITSQAIDSSGPGMSTLISSIILWWAQNRKCMKEPCWVLREEKSSTTTAKIQLHPPVVQHHNTITLELAPCFKCLLLQPSCQISLSTNMFTLLTSH